MMPPCSSVDGGNKLLFISALGSPRFFIGLLGLYVLFVPSKMDAQDTTFLKGVIQNGEALVPDVYIRNLSNAKTVTSDEEGAFKIQAKVGDTLIFMHLSFKESVLFLGQDEFNHPPFIYKMDQQGIALDEVKIHQYPDINAVALGILPEEVEQLTQNERRLNAAGDFKWIHLLGLLGGHLEVDPILNKINGRTKRLKRYIKLDQKMELVHFLKANYLDYMMNELNIPEQDIGGFLYHLADLEALQSLREDNERNQLEFWIVDQWMQYKKLIKED